MKTIPTQFGLRLIRICVAGLVLAALTGACGSAEEFAGPCSDNDDCADGLVCAKGGKGRGLCTTECSSSNFSICRTKFGDGAFCHVDSVCMKKCGAGCPTSTRCDSSADDVDYCVRQ